MEFNARKIKAAILIISFMIASGVFVVSFQEHILRAKANVSSVIVYLDHLDFGQVFPGEQLQKTFSVHYSGSGNANYTIVEKYKPLPGAVIPDGYSGSISDYCQEYFNDFEKCYRDLCPYIEEYSNEGEGDTVTGASVSFSDFIDIWIVYLDAPAITGNISQDHTGGIISVNGIYGCDLSFDLDDPLEGSISGCKYNDANNNGAIDQGEGKLSGWEIQLIGCPYLSGGNLSFISKDGIGSGLPGACVVRETTFTGEDGCYIFDGLDAGDYGVNEVTQNNWTQTYPANDTFYYFPLGDGEDKDGIDFANFTEQQEPYCGDGNLDPGEQCDDGNNINGDGCSSACNTEGGGGTVIFSLQINDAEECVMAEDGVYFSWRTNMASSSRVVCDTEPNPNWGTPPDYGYFLYTDELNLSPRILNHEVKITGLVAGESYYCRVISSNSSSTVFEEVICSTPEEEEEEEGEIKGVIDIIIPEALPKTGFGSVVNEIQNINININIIAILFAAFIFLMLLQYERRKR